MGITTASAPAKIILSGEHSVVYGCPAIALPLCEVRAAVEVSDGAENSGVWFCAADLGEEWAVEETPHNPLSELVGVIFDHIGCPPPDLRITITSTIPIASGMGSGAAVATAVARGVSMHVGADLPPATVSSLVYQCEHHYHGTPSGIDNTVIAYEQPIWFNRDADQPTQPLIEPLTLKQPLSLVIGDTGIRSETRLPVGEVRRRWQSNQQRYEGLFGEMRSTTEQMRTALERGNYSLLSNLININQTLLQHIGVSSQELERLNKVAREAGALAAKLSGGGWGGVMLAMVEPHTSADVAQALRKAGAPYVMETTVKAT